MLYDGAHMFRGTHAVPTTASVLVNVRRAFCAAAAVAGGSVRVSGAAREEGLANCMGTSS